MSDTGIKPLEWKYNERMDEWQAETPFGPELIHFVTPEHYPPNGCFEWNGSEREDDAYPTLEDAKAAAQAGFEANIRSCLATPSHATDTAGSQVFDVAAELYGAIYVEGERYYPETEHDRLSAALSALRAENERLRAANNMLMRNMAEKDAERDRLQAERRMIVSHATMGTTDGEGQSVNDISVQITALRNDLWRDAQAAALTQTDRTGEADE